MGSIGTAYPPKVVDYVGRVQKSPGAALGAKIFFPKIAHFLGSIFLFFELYLTERIFMTSMIPLYPR